MPAICLETKDSFFFLRVREGEREREREHMCMLEWEMGRGKERDRILSGLHPRAQSHDPEIMT